MKKETLENMAEWKDEFPIDLETWLRLHHPKVLIEYEKIKESVYIKE
jgi:hypothetical protein